MPSWLLTLWQLESLYVSHGFEPLELLGGVEVVEGVAGRVAGDVGGDGHKGTRVEKLAGPLVAREGVE